MWNEQPAEALVVENSEEVTRMDARVAEGLVRKWQNIKSQALGPDHCLEKLSEVRKFLLCIISFVW